MGNWSSISCTRHPQFLPVYTQQAYGFSWITGGRDISTAHLLYKNLSCRPSSWVIRYILTRCMMFFTPLEPGTLDSPAYKIHKGWQERRSKTMHYLWLNSKSSLAGRGKTWMMARQAYVTQISTLLGSCTQKNTYLPFIKLHLSPWRLFSTLHWILGSFPPSDTSCF